MIECDTYWSGEPLVLLYSRAGARQTESEGVLEFKEKPNGRMGTNETKWEFHGSSECFQAHMLTPEGGEDLSSHL